MADKLSLPAPTRIPVGTAAIAGQKQEVYLSAEWARYFDSLNTTVVTGIAVPGPPGPPGVAGSAGTPGAAGANGANGVDGAVGAALLMGEAESGPEFIPGPTGPQGATGSAGAQGASGAALFLLAGDDVPTEMVSTPQSTLQAVSVPGSILSSGIAGIGYTVGSGGVVVQATSKATAVTLNTPTGQITMNAASLGASTTVSFTLTNSVIAATDTLDIHRKSGGTALAYNVWVDSIAAGSAVIAVRNITAGALLEAVVLQFTVQKGSNT